MIFQKKISLATRGFNDIIDITPSLRAVLKESSIKNGLILIFVPGSTAGLTTIEYEPGLIEDVPEMLEKMAPMNSRYHHDQTWHDGNGYAHLRAALIGPSLTIPVDSGQLQLGTWQQVVCIDFDNRPRQRQLHVQVQGE
jgi:secondary thiamine-phosphate synthase enzyme